MKAVILVLDSVGVGAMDDVLQTRPQDVGTNTLKHVAEHARSFRVPALESLGAGLVTSTANLRPAGKLLGSYGCSRLAHYGADTFQGHQEIAGARPEELVMVPFQEIAARVTAALRAKGYSVTRPGGESDAYLLVNDLIVVADNIEADPCQNYNVTAPLDDIAFSEALEIGYVVRETVDVSRVIVLGGRRIGVKDILLAVEHGPCGTVGVNCPKSGVYEQGYVVRHLGKVGRTDLQVTTLAKRAGFPVILIGKAADVLTVEEGIYEPCVDTGEVMDILTRYSKEVDEGLIVANVQETDLAGHSRDALRYAEKLMVVDRRLPELLGALGQEDILVITGDHGNDPVKGSGHHTREKALLLVYGNTLRPVSLGERPTLSDIGATTAEFLGVGQTEAGTSFLRRLR